MSKKNRGGPVCHQQACRETRLAFYTDTNGVAWQRCPACGEARQIPRRPAPSVYVPRWQR